MAKHQLVFFAFCVLFSLEVRAQADLAKIILKQDSLFWVTYNTCEIEESRPFFTEDVEFYHDKGGLTAGKENVITTFKKNLCSNPDFRLRREAVEGSVKVFPLQNANTVYGAILSGEHVFYILEKGKNERLDGQANFTHLWLLKDGQWQMSRVLSYDHRPALYVNKRRAIELSAEVLNQYLGTYKGSDTGTIQVTKADRSLVLVIGTKRYVLYPEKETVFFTKDRDLTFEFIKNEKGKVSKFIVREYGAIAEEASFVQ
jgi:hypothetical protein